MQCGLICEFEDEKTNAVGKLWYVKIIGSKNMLAYKEIVNNSWYNKTREANDWDVLQHFLLGRDCCIFDYYIPPLMHITGSVSATQALIYGIIYLFDFGVFDSREE